MLADKNIDYIIIPYTSYENFVPILVHPKDWALIPELVSVNRYDKYESIYSLQTPYVVRLNNEKVIISDCIFVKSYYMDAIMPLDVSVQKYMWANRKKEVHNNTCDNMILLIYTLVNCIINNKKFDLQAKEICLRLIYQVDEKILLSLLQKIFFQYAPLIIKNIKNREFDTCVENYKTYAEY